MEQIVKDITGLVGGTPLLEAARFGQARGLSARLLCKLEYLNPTGSVKDRAALWMLEAAEREGRLAPGATIIEPTSGNTGIGLAAIGASRGYRVILTMPETMSRERRDLLKAYGAQIVLTPGDKGMDGAMQKAAELAASLPGSFIPGQFDNPANPRAHYSTTGPEIYETLGGDWHRRHLDGHRTLPAGEEPGHRLGGGGARGLPGADPGQGRAPWAPGHRGGVCAPGAGYRPVR